jgi:hypothetical protein
VTAVGWCDGGGGGDVNGLFELARVGRGLF